MSYPEYLEAVKQQKEDETILQEKKDDDCVEFEEEGGLDIREQENEINSHNPDQYLQEYIQWATIVAKSSALKHTNPLSVAEALIDTGHKHLKIQCFEGSAHAIHGFKSSGPLGKQ